MGQPPSGRDKLRHGQPDWCSVQVRVRVGRQPSGCDQLGHGQPDWCSVRVRVRVGRQPSGRDQVMASRCSVQVRVRVGRQPSGRDQVMASRPGAQSRCGSGWAGSLQDGTMSWPAGLVLSPGVGPGGPAAFTTGPGHGQPDWSSVQVRVQVGRQPSRRDQVMASRPGAQSRCGSGWAGNLQDETRSWTAGLVLSPGAGPGGPAAFKTGPGYGQPDWCSVQVRVRVGRQPSGRDQVMASRTGAQSR